MATQDGDVMKDFAEDNPSDFKAIPTQLPPHEYGDPREALLKKGVKRRITTYTFDPENVEGGIHENPDGTTPREHHTKMIHGITDTMMYRTRALTTWEAFAIQKMTIWSNPDLWKMMLKLAGVAAVVCVIAIVAIPNPAQMKVAKFTSVSKFLNVVVGLLLGFFLSSSMTRWYTCVNGFLELLDAIRNLQMQLVALGVPEMETILCLRYAFVSAWLLYGQLLLETKSLVAVEGAEKELHSDRNQMWRKLCTKIAHIDKKDKTTLLKESEAEVLRMTRDPPGMMWMWVAALIGRLSQDGWIPPMASPTYGRIMNLCQSAHGGIRQVRAAISVQAPLTYTHMLATLVHINNLLNAVTFGIVSGLAIDCWMIRNGYHYFTENKMAGDPSGREVTQDWQNMSVTFLYCFLGPLVYQALLMISMHLAQPFDSDEAKIPLDRLLVQLEIDMCNGRDLVEHLPFERPAFKVPPKPAVEPSELTMGKAKTVPSPRV
jgi:predicted membrane chloride channel (bestrophin family)